MTATARLLAALLAAPVLLAAAPTAAAETCGPVPDRSAALDPLFEALEEAETPAEGQRIEAEIWEVWRKAPDERAQALLDEGYRLRRSYALAEAEAVLEELTRYCPDYPEGWNQLAAVRFDRGRYAAALETIERVLALEPRHFGALAGRAMSVARQGRMRRAREAGRRAASIHPWIALPAALTEPEGEEL
jgi:tetratricopeptide (TPR) repeat protein